MESRRGARGEREREKKQREAGTTGLVALCRGHSGLRRRGPASGDKSRGTKEPRHRA